MHGRGSTPIACHAPSNGNVSVTLLSVLSLLFFLLSSIYFYHLFFPTIFEAQLNHYGTTYFYPFDALLLN